MCAQLRRQLAETAMPAITIAHGAGSRSVGSRRRLRAWTEVARERKIGEANHNLSIKNRVRLARRGVRHLLVICPAFVADCLEILEEIAAGGETFTVIPCLNDQPPYIQFLAGRGRRFIPSGGAF